MAYEQSSYSRSGNWNAEILLLLVTALSLVVIIIPTFFVRYMLRSTEERSAHRGYYLAFASFVYAKDHEEVYPFGTSSTEIFQKLCDGKYIDQAAIVFISTNGGKRLYSGPVPIKGLKPENVSWDYVTRDDQGLKSSDPLDLPLVFSDVATPPMWGAGVNNVTLTSSNPWGTDGVLMCTLGQQAMFKRARDVAGVIPLTESSFKPTPGVTYGTRKP